MASERTYSTISVSDGYDDYDIAPLTTVWTIPDGCPSPIQFNGVDQTYSSSCWPPDYERVWYDGGVYSPGLCISGYTSGCQPTDDYGGPLKSTETAMMCVPSGYSCSGFQFHASSVSNGKIISVPMVQIRWAETDLVALETNPLSPGSEGSTTATATGSTVTVTGSGTAATESESSASSSGSSGSSGLPTGAVVGIAVGSAAVVGIIAAIIFFLFRRRNKKKQAGGPPAPPIEPYTGVPELPGSGQPVGFVADPKHPPPGGNGTVSALERRIYELEQREKALSQSPPPVAYGADGIAYTPNNSYGGANAYSPTSPHGGPGPGARHEMGVYERPVAEMEAQAHGGYPRHELS